MNYGGNGKRFNTGLHALPGKPVTVGIPEGAAGRGLTVEIGIHVDANWHHEVWRRFPDVMRRDRLDKARTVTANPFGGLISIVVPPGAALGQVAVEIDGAVEAPHFVLGEDDAAGWARLRELPGAWGYIESPLMSVISAPRDAGLGRCPGGGRALAAGDGDSRPLHGLRGGTQARRRSPMSRSRWATAMPATPS